MKKISELRALHRAAVADFEAAEKKGDAGSKKAAKKIEEEIIEPIEQAMAFLVLKKGHARIRGLNQLSDKLETALADLNRSIDRFFIDDFLKKAKELGLSIPSAPATSVGETGTASAKLPETKAGTTQLGGAQARGAETDASQSAVKVSVLKLTEADWRAIFPKAPDDVIDAFVADKRALDKAGITHSRTRLAYALANVEHECDGFSIRNLTENINYTAKRMAEVWPNRFSSAEAVREKYGTVKGWQKKAIDDIYGGRMGNKEGTNDGSTFIGRGGPQITGRDGYSQVGRRAGLDLENNPELAASPEHQPAILAAFWEWKNMAKFADKGDFKGCVKAWNGGTNGIADRKLKLKGNDPIIERLNNVAAVMPKLEAD